MGAALLACCLGGCSGGSGAPGTHAASFCTYPAGPYGTHVGDVVDPSLSWQGYLDDGAQAQPVAMRAYFDCDGSKGVNVLLLDESATWCTDCQAQAQRIAPEVTSSWKSHGVHMVTLMAEDQTQSPATLTTALSWRNEYSLTSGAVCADPG
ncbi:MAG TPA: hypothetical protein VIF09_05445, partial [Polyangiaceae bacterium]